MAEYVDQHLRGEAEKGGGEGRRESHDLAASIGSVWSSAQQMGEQRGGLSVSQDECQLLSKQQRAAYPSTIYERQISEIQSLFYCSPAHDDLACICFAVSSHAALNYIFVVFMQPNKICLYLYLKVVVYLLKVYFKARNLVFTDPHSSHPAQPGLCQSHHQSF